jgi:hypothetical protein
LEIGKLVALAEGVAATAMKTSKTVVLIFILIVLSNLPCQQPRLPDCSTTVAAKQE